MQPLAVDRAAVEESHSSKAEILPVEGLISIRSTSCVRVGTMVAVLARRKRVHVGCEHECGSNRSTSGSIKLHCNFIDGYIAGVVQA
jgi:hypothetical protein